MCLGPRTFKAESYRSEGITLVNEQECPLFKHGSAPSCVGGSGDNACLYFDWDFYMQFKQEIVLNDWFLIHCNHE